MLAQDLWFVHFFHSVVQITKIAFRIWVCWAKIMSNVNICSEKRIGKNVFEWKLPVNFSMDLMRVQFKWIDVHFPQSRKFHEFSIQRDNTSFFQANDFWIDLNLTGFNVKKISFAHNFDIKLLGIGCLWVCRLLPIERKF